MRDIFAAVLVAMAFVPSTAGLAGEWGQEVKACNQSDCYPGGTSRGTYVRDQARDTSGQGYGSEIHQLANPGKSDPKANHF